MNVDLHVMDAAWYTRYYVPRELRYVFGPMVDTLTEYLMYMYTDKFKTTVIDQRSFRDFLISDYSL